MRNEQCGICWDLKFDKKGKNTHGILHSHDFTPFDFCIRCRKPKFDHQGFLTHPSVYDLAEKELGDTHHDFISSVEIKNKIQRKKQKLLFICMGIISIAAIANTNLAGLLF